MPRIKKTMEQLVKNNLKILNEEIKDLKENKENTFDVIATTEDVDRDGEIIKTDGWETDNWFKNPVVLGNHSYLIQDIAGKGLEFYKDENDKMRLKGVFSNNEMGKMAKELYNGGFLKAVSVGFMVKQRNESDRLIIEKAELLEISFVAVPANPEAISMDGKSYQKALESGIIVKGEDEHPECAMPLDPDGSVSEEEKECRRKAKADDIKNAPTLDLSAFGPLSEKELNLVSNIITIFEKKIEKSELAFDEKLDKIRKSIKEVEQEEVPDDNGNDTPNDSEEKELYKKFFQNLSKSSSEILCQMKKGK